MRRALLLAALLALAPVARAQTPVTPNLDHAAMLASPDPVLAANKRLVYDFWREVFEALHMDRADRYLSERYIQHNPLVPNGRQAFVDFFSRRGPPRDIADRVQAPLVAIIAEGDLVMLAFVRDLADPQDLNRRYTTTWFDMFRIRDGRIDEHWDPATRR